MQNESHEFYMLEAIKQAKIAKSQGDWPFGAVIVRDGKIIGQGHVKERLGGDVTDHAEMVAIRDACFNIKSNNLGGSTIYCTNEPCLMCASGIFQANIDKVVIGLKRDDLPQLLRSRKLRIDNLVEDNSFSVEIIKGILKDQILELFQGIRK
jgi:tRNA(Arg) A34 adenosine deaminase TadA